MKKIYVFLTILALFSFTAKAQNWQIYDGSVLPSETTAGDMLDISNYSDDSPGEGMVTEVMMDPNIPGNYILKYFQPDGKRTFRHDMSDTYTGTDFTIVARVKGNNDPAYDRVMDIRWDNGNTGTRDELRMYYSGRLKLEKAGVDTYPEIDFNEWHIFRIKVTGDSATVFIDENPEPVLAGKTTSTSDDQRVRFGDGSGDAIGGYVDWFILDTLSASSPDEQAIPVDLTGQGNDEWVDWHLYTASVMPDENIPPFEESNTSGDNYINNIIDDPDMPGNKLLELVSSPASTNFMWKHNFPEDNTTILTMVARVKAVSDTVDRPMEFDLRHGGFRERLFINTDGTYELKYAGVKEDLPAGIDMLDWHTYRLTKIDDQVNFYLDEDPVAIASVTTTETTTDNYFRFGDGNGSYEIGGYVDWVAWTTSGVYGPDEVGMPDVNMKSDDATLAALTPSEGTLVPDFHPDSTDYELLLPAGTNSVSFTADPNYAASAISGDGELTPLPGTATIIVTAENGVTQEYVVNVTLDEVLSDDATLSALTTDLGDLDPTFSSDTYSYDLELPAGSTSVTFTATATNENAGITGDGTFNDVPGTAVIVVTAEDGVTTQEYTINVTVSSTGMTPDLNSLVKVYPNPAKNNVRINTLPDSHVYIYNALGKPVFEKKMLSNQLDLDLTGFGTGIYLIRIQWEDQDTLLKLIKK